jgi:hypothetical protein
VSPFGGQAWGLGSSHSEPFGPTRPGFVFKSSWGQPPFFTCRFCLKLVPPFGGQAWGLAGSHSEPFGPIRQTSCFQSSWGHPLFSHVGSVHNRCTLLVLRLGGWKVHTRGPSNRRGRFPKKGSWGHPPFFTCRFCFKLVPPFGGQAWGLAG